jgi:hypothetical protein
MSGLRLDLGCGPSKKEGTLGLDKVAWPGVDHVVDFETDRLPWPDGSVEYVFSAHCLEHLQEPGLLLGEVSRICQDGACLEFWTPYAWENSAFVFGHRTFYNEDHYLHMCLWFAGLWRSLLGKRWVLRDIVYVIDPPVLADLFRRRIDLDFALRYYKGIVREFGVLIDVWRDFPGPEPLPRRWFAADRYAERHPLPPVVFPRPDVPAGELAEATAWFSAPFSATPGDPPSSLARGVCLLSRLAARARAVAREEGAAAVVRRTLRYLERVRIARTTSAG